MSHTYNIACHDCQVSLWLGQCSPQDDLSQGFLYTTGRAQQLQRNFFFDHIGHRLEFNTSEHFDATDSFREMEWTKAYPEQAGFYWYKNLLFKYQLATGEKPDATPRIVELYAYYGESEPGAGLYILFTGDEVPVGREHIESAQWYGPLAPPEEEGES
ncbi:MAG: hypothetical protein MOB07_23130 [Acidobacteria bacterium]|nr:hypothetical protein [Acidobacteriota bacterium]